MVFTMNTAVFAEEVPADVDSVDEIFAEEAVEVVLVSESDYSDTAKATGWTIDTTYAKAAFTGKTLSVNATSANDSGIVKLSGKTDSDSITIVKKDTVSAATVTAIIEAADLGTSVSIDVISDNTTGKELKFDYKVNDDEVAVTETPDDDSTVYTFTSKLNTKEEAGAPASANNAAMAAKYIKTVSENIDKNWIATVSGQTYSFNIVYNMAVGYDGRKLDWSESNKAKSGTAKGIDVSLYYAEGNSQSENAVSENGSLNKGWIDITDKIAKNGVKIKSINGATVSLDGTGLVPLKKSAYITSIKLDTKSFEDKEVAKAIKKELDAQLKDAKKFITKEKKDDVVDVDDVPNCVISVYPAFVNDGSDASKKLAEEYKNVGISTLNVGDSKKGLDITSKKVIALDKKDKKLVKSIKGDWEVSGKVKKVTLKPDKVKSGKAPKYNGLFNKDEKAKGAKGEAVKGADGKETGDYTVKASGNFFGYIQFNPNVK